MVEDVVAGTNPPGGCRLHPAKKNYILSKYQFICICAILEYTDNSGSISLVKFSAQTLQMRHFWGVYLYNHTIVENKINFMLNINLEFIFI